MPTQRLTVRARHYLTGQPVSVEIEKDRILAIKPLQHAEASLPTIAPGLIDLQINGYAGDDFNAPPIPSEMVGRLARLLWSEGVTCFYPTVITNTDQAITEALQSIARACENDSVAANAIPGIHLEGPFISLEDGARGAHAREHVRPPDWDLFCRWQDAAAGRIRILTMSPEWPASADFIARCTESGVTVSIGHTAATSDQIAAAVQSGARMSTHLGNGTHLTLPRHPNYIWEQLAQDALHTCMIADGFHLPDQVIKVILKVKGAKALIVSDAVSLAGLPAGEYTTPVGGKVILTPQGRLHLKENDKLLAGSAQMLLAGITHLTARGLADLPEAWDLASLHPAMLMKRPQSQGLCPGAPADLVIFRADPTHQIEIHQTYKSGQLVYERAV